MGEKQRRIIFQPTDKTQALLEGLKLRGLSYNKAINLILEAVETVDIQFNVDVRFNNDNNKAVITSNNE